MNNLDKDFNKMTKFVIGSAIAVLVGYAVVFGFIGFVIWKVLEHFGIL